MKKVVRNMACIGLSLFLGLGLIAPAMAEEAAPAAEEAVVEEAAAAEETAPAAEEAAVEEAAPAAEEAAPAAAEEAAPAAEEAAPAAAEEAAPAAEEAAAEEAAPAAEEAAAEAAAPAAEEAVAEEAAPAAEEAAAEETAPAAEEAAAEAAAPAAEEAAAEEPAEEKAAAVKEEPAAAEEKAEAAEEETAKAPAAKKAAAEEEEELDGDAILEGYLAEEPDLGDPELPFWTEGAEVTESIKAYVEAACDEDADTFIPVKDRIAVFDFDGTLYGELYPTYFDTTMFVHRVLHDETFDAPEELKEIAEEMEDGMKNRKMPDGSEEILATSVPKAYKGLTVSQYEDYIRSFMSYPCDGFEGITYGDGFYLPMISLVKYLSDHDFEVWVCSGTDRICARTLVDHGLGWWISPSRVIGTQHTMVAAEQDGADPLDYVYKSDDDVVMAGELIVKNLKMNKVTAMVNEIGKVPVLAFGNSTGDLSMAQYTCNNKKYEGRAYLLLCDDTERDYGNPAKAEKLAATCEKSGFHTVSMKDDFTTIYGHDVHMVDHTDNYTWTEPTIAFTSETADEAEEETEAVKEKEDEEETAEAAAEEETAEEETAEEEAAEEEADDAA